MSFEYWFIRYWWRVFVVLLVAGPIAWIWAPTAMLTILMVYAVVIGASIGIRRLIGRWNSNASGIYGCSCCGCCDGCDHWCDERKRKCKIHGYVFPKARTR